MINCDINNEMNEALSDDFILTILSFKDFKFNL